MLILRAYKIVFRLVASTPHGKISQQAGGTVVSAGQTADKNDQNHFNFSFQKDQSVQSKSGTTGKPRKSILIDKSRRLSHTRKSVTLLEKSISSNAKAKNSSVTRSAGKSMCSAANKTSNASFDKSGSKRKSKDESQTAKSQSLRDILEQNHPSADVSHEMTDESISDVQKSKDEASDQEQAVSFQDNNETSIKHYHQQSKTYKPSNFLPKKTKLKPILKLSDFFDSPKLGNTYFIMAIFIQF